MKKTWFLKHFGSYKWVGWAICILAAVFYCYEYSLRILPSIISGQLRVHYSNLSLGAFGVLSSLYYWAYTPMQAVVGVSTDRYGPRHILLLAIILCVIGNYLFGATNNVYIAGIGRLLTGAGSAFAFVGALKLAALWLPKKYFPFFSGIIMSIGMLAAIIGDYLMTWISIKWGWMTLIVSGSIVGLILFVLFFIFVHEKTIPTSRKKKQNSLGFMYKNFWKLLTSPKYILLGLIGCFLYLSLDGFADIWGIPFIKMIYPNDALEAANINSMVFWGWFFGAPLISFIASKYNQRVSPLRYGSFIAAVLFLIILAYPHLPITLLCIILFLFGLLCSSETLCFVIARDYASLRFAATAMGVVNLIIMISGIILQPLIARIVDWTWHGQMHNGLQIYTLGEYREALLIIPFFLIISGALTFFLKDNVSTLK
jgi:MFS family permease